MPTIRTSKKQLLSDLEWAYARLDHLHFVHKYPLSVPGHFGMGDSFEWIEARLPELRKRYGFAPTWDINKEPAYSRPMSGKSWMLEKLAVKA